LPGVRVPRRAVTDILDPPEADRAILQALLHNILAGVHQTGLEGTSSDQAHTTDKFEIPAWTR